jgi:acetyl esterase/lipase
MAVDLDSEPGFGVLVHDVVYSRQDDFDWQARIFQPDGDGPFPTLLHVHGGAWTRGDRTRNVVLCEALAARGVLIAAIDVHAPPVGGYPAAMRDVNVGARWLKAKAAEFNGSSRIGAIGTSTGGHQAILCGMQPHQPSYSDLPGEPGVDASLAYVVAIWPVIDPLSRYHLVIADSNEDYVWAHNAFWGSEDAMAEGSPQLLLERGVPDIQTPPVLIVQREVDKLHPRDMAEKFVTSYRDRGGEAEMVVLPDLPPMFRMDASGERLLKVVLPFIHQHAG